jgi:L-histidine Nalpha-methyltransferase
MPEEHGADSGSVFGRLQHALRLTDFPWSLCLLGEDQTGKLNILTAGLSGDEEGEGKHISSGFSYWGIGPAIAWAYACGDPFYPVMYRSIESFARNWASCLPDLEGVPYHYVSLGVGTGSKDNVVLRDLMHGNPDLLYMPVDMSTEMLRLGADEAARRMKRGQMLPVQLDISAGENVDELRLLLHSLVGDEPILYGLLGNTLANFDEDTALLAGLTTLLRPQDRLLLEVATTETLDGLEQAAASEYANSRAFKEFVTSALWHNTDLTVDMNGVRLHGGVEADRAIRIEARYHNLTGATIRMTLPNRIFVDFTPAQTIRLYLSRKYSRNGLAQLLAGSNLTRVNTAGMKISRGAGRSPFGVELMLVAGAGTDGPVRVAEDIWRNPPRGRSRER